MSFGALILFVIVGCICLLVNYPYAIIKWALVFFSSCELFGLLLQDFGKYKWLIVLERIIINLGMIKFFDTAHKYNGYKDITVVAVVVVIIYILIPILEFLFASYESSIKERLVWLSIVTLFALSANIVIPCFF